MGAYAHMMLIIPDRSEEKAGIIELVTLKKDIKVQSQANLICDNLMTLQS